jgi:hypothetical protein
MDSWMLAMFAWDSPGSVLVDSIGLGDRRGCDECKELLESEQWLAI